MYFSTPYASTQVSLRKNERKPDQHYEDYNHFTYIHEMTRFVLRRRKMFQRSYVINDSRRNVLEVKLQDAIQKRQIYTILGYYPAVKHILMNLGWVEKIEPDRYKVDHLFPTNFMLIHLDSAPYIIKDETLEGYNAQIHEGKYQSDQLREKEARVDLLFSLRKNYIPWNALHHDTIVSYFPRSNFCSKLGLNNCLEQIPIFSATNDSLKFPRGFNMSNVTSMRRFTQNFRETSCFSLMRHVAYILGLRQTVCSKEGTISWTTFDRAEKTCKDCIRRLQLESIDDIENVPNRYEREESINETQTWSDLTQDIYNVTNQMFFFEDRTDNELPPILERAQNIVEALQKYYKEEMFDGTFNVWVLKPIANCSGHGIRIFRQLEDVRKILGPLQNLTYARFVLQKYIERPMLIHGVKFDLRLWFVVTNIHRFKIWVYQEGYVRFCSKPYSNMFLDAARHLTNVRIQAAYRNSRDPPQLPLELMWDFKQLREYFVRELSLARQWSVIMKAMEDAVLTVMRCALSVNYIGLRKNCFQLFGADFLIHENYSPCLIEVNNGPGLSPTTSVIAKKTTELLTDMIKVVVAEKDPIASVQTYAGNFHLIHDTNISRPLGPNAEATLKALKTTQIDLLELKKSRAKELQSNAFMKRQKMRQRSAV